MSRAQKVVVGTPYKIRAHRVCAVIPQVKKRPGGARRVRCKVTNYKAKASVLGQRPR